MQVIKTIPNKVKLYCEKCGKVKWLLKSIFKHKGYECNCQVKEQLPKETLIVEEIIELPKKTKKTK